MLTDALGLLETGLVSGTISLIVGLIGLRLFRHYIIRGLINDSVSYLTEPDVSGQIRTALEQEITKYATEALKYVHDNPKALTPVLTGLINDLGQAIPKDALTGAVGGEIVGNLAQNPSILQFVPRRYRGLAAIAQMFLGKSETPQNQPQSGNFG